MIRKLLRDPTPVSFYSIVTMLWASLSLAPANAAPLDFDLDGSSDRTVVEIQDDGDLVWRAQGLNSPTELGEVGRLGDNLIPGPWIAAGVPLIGFVRASGSSVTWNVIGDSGLQSVTFGSTADLQISGADFNGDGTIDGAFSSTSGRARTWSINTGLFSSGTTSTVRHGRSKDTPFFMDPTASGDWLAVLVKPSSGPLRIHLRNPFTGEQRRISRISRSLINFSRPIPLKGTDGIDSLVFVRKGSASTRAVILGPTGRRIAQSSVSEEAEVLVGEFNADPGEEVAFATSAGFVAYNPTTKISNTHAAPTGIAVDEVNITTFATEDDSGLPTPRDTCYEGDPTDGSKLGFIWKPASDTQFGAVVILPGTYKNKVREVRTTTQAGATIRTLAFKGNANPDPGGAERPHYIDRSMQGGQYRRAYRTIYVEADFINGACMRYLIENPATRVD